MRPLAKKHDPTTEGGEVISTMAQTTLLHGKPIAAGRITITRPGYVPLIMTKEGEGKVMVEGLVPFDSGDSPLSPESQDAVIG